MMNYLMAFKSPAKVAFHYYAMLESLFPSSNGHHHIAVLVNIATAFPMWVFWPGRVRIVSALSERDAVANKPLAHGHCGDSVVGGDRFARHSGQVFISPYGRRYASASTARPRGEIVTAETRPQRPGALQPYLLRYVTKLHPGLDHRLKVSERALSSHVGIVLQPRTA